MRTHTLIKNFVSQAAIAPYRIVKFGTADSTVIQSANAADNSIGVANNLGASASGQRTDVVLAGIAEVEYGGNVTRGSFLTSNADGKAVAASTGNRAIGVAMVSGVSGDIGFVLIDRGLA